MKSLFGLFLVLVLNSALANIKIEEELFVFSSDAELIEKIQNNTELIIDHRSDSGFEIYGPKGTKTYIKDLGLDFIDIAQKISNKEFADYPTHEELTQKLMNLVNRNPSIAKLISIGNSVQGRPLWVVKISDNVDVDEVEPEFKYISSMHGDEITGRELLPFLIEDLIKGYGADKQITDLIDNTEIFIMPSMNPDGSKARRRANANGIDLNRNFPDFTRNDQNNRNGKEVETVAIMAFQAERNFSLSANFHGGAVVVNYPWDSTYDRHPFDALVQEISLEYANLNPEMRTSTSFARGITNGADWYVLHGGMQDWSYFWHNDLQVTVELSDAKWPNYSQIANYYRDNKDSMIAFMNKVHMGAGIRFNDNQKTGSVEVIHHLSSNEQTSLGSYSFIRGEFYKVLTPGVYTFKVKTAGKTQQVNVNVDENSFGYYKLIE